MVQRNSDDRLSCEDVLSAVNDALFILDEQGRIQYINQRAEQLWGRPRAELLDKPFLACFPELQGSRTHEAINDALGRGNPVTFDAYCPVVKSWIHGNASPSNAGLVVHFHRTSPPTEVVARHSEARLHEILNNMAVGVYITDTDGVILRYNEQAVRIWGRAPAQGERLCACRRVFDAEGHLLGMEDTPIAQVLRTGQAVPQTQVTMERVDGSRVVALATPSPIRNGEGKLVGVINCMTDITQRHRDERLLQSLADVGAALAESLEYEKTLGNVARLLVPRWADWCAIDLLDESGGIVNVGVAHIDPRKLAVARQLRARSPLSVNGAHGAANVIRTGEPVFYGDLDDEVMREVAQYSGQIASWRELGLRSALVVPLMARGRTIGALTLCAADTPHRFTEEDLPHVTELARRCALVVDNARLYEQMQHELAQRTVAETRLQQLNETLEQRVAERTVEARTRARQLQRMTIELAQAEQRERRRMAQVLHDDHQQMLVAARMQLEVLKHAPPEDLHKQVNRVTVILQEAIRNSRMLSHRLSPPLLDARGLADALRRLIPWKQQLYGLTLHVDADDEAQPQNPDLQLLLIQCVRELILNVVKHADTREVWVRTRRNEANDVVIEVEDHGKGFDAAELDRVDQPHGLGLLAMRERISFFGGMLEVHSAPGQGAQVTLTVPATADAQMPHLHSPGEGVEASVIPL